MHVIGDVFVGSLQELNAGLSNGDKVKAKEAFLAKVAEVQSQLEMDKRKQLEAAQKSSSGGGGGGDKKVWSEEELQMLIKAVNLFPAGTQDRCVYVWFGSIIGGSRHNNATSIFVATTPLLLQQACFCRDKIMFVTTKYFCLDKRHLYTPKVNLSQQKFCRDKIMFVATNICCYKSFVAT